MKRAPAPDWRQDLWAGRYEIGRMQVSCKPMGADQL